jgi:UPF0716 family protein affecting phage T7 exclusion
MGPFRGGRSIGPVERIALIVSGVLLFYAGTIHDVIGSLILAAIVLLQVHKYRLEKRRVSIGTL